MGTSYKDIYMKPEGRIGLQQSYGGVSSTSERTEAQVGENHLEDIASQWQSQKWKPGVLTSDSEPFPLPYTGPITWKENGAML